MNRLTLDITGKFNKKIATLVWDGYPHKVLLSAIQESDFPALADYLYDHAGDNALKKLGEQLAKHEDSSIVRMDLSIQIIPELH